MPSPITGFRLRADVAAVAALVAATWLTLVVFLAPTARSNLLARISGDQVPPGAYRARVVSVVDGDTLVVEDGSSVRLLGLDAPETNNPAMTSPQAFGPEAAERLRQLVDGRHVHLERDITDQDHYGRLLRHVWVDGRLAAEVLLQEGLARSMSIPPDRKHVATLRAAEADARRAKRGLWGMARPTPLPLFGASP